ncbi:MAG: malonyl-ACP O-methyltransferase BioC [Pseudomonadota bacterium]|nr:malonyl-ACP O-methyltransferase BioC [Pseudomonadota bacterium]
MNAERATQPPDLDRALVRRAFERAAATYDKAAVLQREVGQRMAERLGLVRMHPETILDAGCGTGVALGELHARYPDARLIGLDVALSMTLAARNRAGAATRSARSLLGRVLGPLAPARAIRPWCICGDIASLPIKPASIDLVWSNLTLQWVGDPQKAFAECRRVLRVGGLLSFTTFGPDTLKELRAAFLAADRATHVGRFIDMHDLGDMLVHAGFADPVMDMETLTLTYGDAIGLMRDLKAIGAHNVTAGRPRGMMGRHRWQRMLAALETTRRDGRLPASFEVVYGHAWNPLPRMTDDGSAIIRVEPRAKR